MLCSEHLEDAFEVVSHDRDADFRLSTRQASKQQARMTEDAVFDCSEGMLNRGSSQPHRRRSRAFVHAVQCVVIDGTRANSPCRFGAEAPARANCTVLRGGLVADRAHRSVQLLPRQRLAFGAEEGVALGLVVEGAAIEKAMRVDAALGRNMGYDPDLFTAAGVFSVRVAS